MHHAGDGAQGRALAGPVRADQGDDLPLVDLKRYPFQGMDMPVVAVDILNCQAGSCHFLLMLSGNCAAAQVGLDHPGVAADLRRRALGDFLPVIHDADILGNVHDHPHIVLDQQDGDAHFHRGYCETAG